MTKRVYGPAYSLTNSHSPLAWNVVDPAVGEPVQEGLVLLEPLRGDEPHEEAPVRRVLGWVEGGIWSLKGRSSR